MPTSSSFSRRNFIAGSSALAAHHLAPINLLAQAVAAVPTALRQHAIPPPLQIQNGVSPLFLGGTARPLRYTPIGTEFVIRNGSEFFNRPLYGKHNEFRVDAGDRPEFSLYLPGHGGNLKFGIVTPRGSKWAADSDDVVARYQSGRMIYEIKDKLLRAGTLRIEVVTGPAGLLVKLDCDGVPPSTSLTWAFAGADGRKGSRNGDIGCESVPVSKYFQVRPEDCVANLYSIQTLALPGVSLPAARLHAPGGDILLAFPPASRLAVEDFQAWQSMPSVRSDSAGSPHLPVLTGSLQVSSNPLYVAVWRSGPEDDAGRVNPAEEFHARTMELASLGDTLRAETPDPYIDAAASAFGPAADFLWDTQANCVMHGDVAWRARLAGWRGPYNLDALGNHERAKRQFRHWLAMQNVSPVTTGDPATGPADPNTRLARKEGMLHTNGDLSHNHYDMNMVFFDVLFRHLRWTGDLEFAKEVWPGIQRQLAWEHRLFRRIYTAKDGSHLPLYEAYAAIWASDNLQYSGGGTAHSSAYNIFAFRTAAALAALLRENPEPYRKEAELILQGMQDLLWIPEQGAYAESKDLYEPQTAYSNPALWTVYHTIDSEVPTPRQAWQMIAERVAVLGRIPVHGEGVPPGPWYMLSCSNWMPYMWSLNLIVLAENTHTALAMWQAGMRDEAFALFKGNLLDSMFMGLCPGDFHMTSALDPHRHEAQRDFGDPIGITSRAYIEGLFGVQPNLIADEIKVRPGFPDTWDHASLKHRDFDLNWHRDGLTETYEFTSRFPRPVPVVLHVPARTTQMPVVTNNGAPVEASFDPEAVGGPMLLVRLASTSSYSVHIRWNGSPPAIRPEVHTYGIGESLALPRGVSLARVDDPQRALSSGRVAEVGFHTVFANMTEGDCRWSMPISFEVKPTAVFSPVPTVARGLHAETIDLSAVLIHQITEIFDHPYAEPRSPFCSLSIPDTLLGGWSSLGKPIKIEDSGLRNAGGVLQSSLGVPFRTPAGDTPNCLLLSYFKPYSPSVSVPLSGKASGVYLLVTGTTHPQCSRMQNAVVTVTYGDGSTDVLSLRNPETWWPIEQDYMIDDYMFSSNAPLPPRIDLATGQTRILDIASFKGKGRDIEGGAATVLYLPLDPEKLLTSLRFEVSLYPIVAALLSVTLVRPDRKEMNRKAG